MKTRRWILWTMLAGFLLSALPAMSAELLGQVHKIRGKKGSWKIYNSNGSLVAPSSMGYAIRIGMPDGIASMTFQTGYDSHGGYGDCDLYLRKGKLPTRSTYYRRSMKTSHKEKITITNPSSGYWYLRIWAYKSYRTCLRIYFTRSSNGGGGGGGGTPTDWRQDMLNRVNYQRGLLNRAAVSINSQLENMAGRYAYDMSSKGYYGGEDHVGTADVGVTLRDRFINSGYLTGYGTWAGAENIAPDWTSVAAVMNAWINSPRHYANMTNPNFVHAGFGAKLRADNTYYRWVQMFAYRQ